MPYTVRFVPEAEDQLAEIYRYVATAASPEIAARYAESIIAYCEGLHSFPHRGTRRDDIRPGLRITNDRNRVVIAFVVDADHVLIVGIFYAGRDYESELQADFDDRERGG